MAWTAGGTQAAPAFVAGSTGYTGRQVVRALLDAGIPAVAHIRPDSPQLDQWRLRFGPAGAIIDTTAWNEAAMTETLKKLRPAYIFMLLGTTRARAAAEAARTRKEVSYATVDAGLSLMLIQAATAAGIRPKFIYLSSMGVGPRAMGAYLRARWSVEEALARSGFPHVIARPSFITGNDRDDFRPLEYYGAKVADALFGALAAIGLPGPQENYGSVSPAILARNLVRLAVDPQASGVVQGAALKS